MNSFRHLRSWLERIEVALEGDRVPITVGDSVHFLPLPQILLLLRSDFENDDSVEARIIQGAMGPEWLCKFRNLMLSVNHPVKT